MQKFFTFNEKLHFTCFQYSRSEQVCQNTNSVTQQSENIRNAKRPTHLELGSAPKDRHSDTLPVVMTTPTVKVKEEKSPLFD